MIFADGYFLLRKNVKNRNIEIEGEMLFFLSKCFGRLFYASLNSISTDFEAYFFPKEVLSFQSKTDFFQ
jgi:hypothetical protein